MSDVPIVGQPGQILIWYPTVMIRCMCDPAIQSLVIMTGIGNPSKCGKCGKLWMCEGFVTTNRGDVQPAIKWVIPTPPGEVM